LAIKRDYEESGLGGRAFVSIADKHYLIKALDREKILEVDLATIRTVLVWSYILLLNAPSLMNSDQGAVIFAILVQETVRYKEVLMLLLFPNHGPSTLENHFTLVGV